MSLTPTATHPPPPGDVPDADAIARCVAELAAALATRGLRIATAESCTGGGIAAACTDRAGSSDWFDRGIVSYSNAAKTELLGVPAPLIAAHGAVSEPVARAMAAGMLQRAAAQLAVAVTGVAGPGGGSADKPVGTVWFAWAWAGADGTPLTEAAHRRFDGDRTAVRRHTVAHALAGLLARADRPLPTPPNVADHAAGGPPP